jgi:hypothetical protein
MSTAKDDEGAGCAFLIGLVILAIALGSMHGAAVGWAIIGIGFLAAALL